MYYLSSIVASSFSCADPLESGFDERYASCTPYLRMRVNRGSEVIEELRYATKVHMRPTYSPTKTSNKEEIKPPLTTDTTHVWNQCTH